MYRAFFLLSLIGDLLLKLALNKEASDTVILAASSLVNMSSCSSSLFSLFRLVSMSGFLAGLRRCSEKKNSFRVMLPPCVADASLVVVVVVVVVSSEMWLVVVPRLLCMLFSSVLSWVVCWTKYVQLYCAQSELNSVSLSSLNSRDFSFILLICVEQKAKFDLVFHKG